jgi:hypothetical protein
VLASPFRAKAAQSRRRASPSTTASFAEDDVADLAFG